MGISIDPPSSDEIEVNVFGPGYGESSLVHFGSNEWMIIDSCLDEARKPAPLAYLEAIGVDPAESVKIVMVTHWHDDHIRGLSSIVEACASASFCASAAMKKTEFLETVAVFDSNHGTIAGSGTSELYKTFKLLAERKSPKPIAASANKVVLQRQPEHVAHGCHIRIWALSPSDAQYDKFMDELRALMPRPNNAKRRAPVQSPNHLSVATLVEFGEHALLFGADLEETGVAELGWSAIVGSRERPRSQALFFKVPHHGSQNGHHDGVWQDLLLAKPICVLTPWNRVATLPTPEDIVRIRNYSSQSYSTSDLREGRTALREPAVRKQIGQSTKIFRSIEPRGGHVRLRINPNTGELNSPIQLQNGACTLEDMLPLAIERVRVRASRDAEKKA